MHMKHRKNNHDHKTGMKKNEHDASPKTTKKLQTDVDEHAERNNEYDDFNKRTGVEKIEPVMEESHKTAHE